MCNEHKAIKDIEDILADVRQLRKDRHVLMAFLRKLATGDEHKYIKNHNIGYEAKKLLRELE